MRCTISAADMDVPPGTAIEDASTQAIQYAHSMQCPVRFYFKGLAYVARPAFVSRDSASDEVPVGMPDSIKAGDRFDARALTENHWQVRRFNSHDMVVSIWNVYPTTRNVCIDPKHPGPRLEFNWRDLTLDDLTQAAMQACARKGNH